MDDTDLQIEDIPVFCMALSHRDFTIHDFYKKGVTLYMCNQFYVQNPGPSLPDKVKQDIYDDAFHPAAVQSGKALETVVMLINKMLSPLRKFAQSGEENTDKLQNSIQEHLKNFSPQEIKEPPKNIAVPALVANSYTDADELRALYANLISNSMYIPNSGYAHPAFLEIINQLTPDEALLLKTSNLLKSSQPICEIRYQKKSVYTNYNHYQLSPINIVRDPTEGFSIFKYYITNIQSVPIGELQIMIENFIRLNLIEFPQGSALLQQDIYQEFYKDSFNKKIEDTLLHDEKFRNDYELAHILGYLVPTNFGRRFYKICVSSPTE